MDREFLLERVGSLRGQGKSIRAIAAELGIHPSRVQRAAQQLDRQRQAESAAASAQLDAMLGPDIGTFVGRQREIDQLREALDDALLGRGRLEMLVGEPGIGKTRTAQELANEARRAGVQVLWGWCYEEEGAPPYWPWINPLRTYIHQCHPQQLRSEMGPGAADIAEIIPDLRNRLPELQPPPALDNPESAQFRLFDSITSFLVAASRTQPMLIVLDDLHWANRPSLLLLQFLVRKLVGSRILVVGCYREEEISLQHPLSDTLAQLVRESGFRRQVLQGFSQVNTACFIEQETGEMPPVEAVGAIHNLTEGNPFFLTEVVRLLSERGELGEAANSITRSVQIPLGVREAIGQRLNRRSEHCNRMLTTASVIGREFSLNLIGRLMAEVSADDLLAALEEALAAGMVEAMPESPGRYRFTHALVQSTLSGELSDARRARMHARIGETLEDLYSSDLTTQAATLAYHFAEALPVVGPEKLMRYSLLAGEQAIQAYAAEEALRHFERALAAKKEESTDAETAALLLRLGRAQAAVLTRGRWHEALDSLTRAFDYYVRTEDFDSAMEVAQFPLATSIAVLPGAAALISRALPLVAPESPAAGQLQIRNAWNLGRQRGDYDGACAALDQALNIARRQRDPNLEMDALAASAEIDVFHLRCQKSVEKSLRAIELARMNDDPRAEIQARQRATLALTIIGDLEGARFHAEEGLVPAQRLRDRFWSSTAFWGNQFVSRLSGDWAASRDHSDRGLEIHPTDQRNLADRTLLEYDLGDFRQGNTYLERLLEIRRGAAPSPTTAYSVSALVLPLLARINDALDVADLVQNTAEALRSGISAAPLLVSMADAGLALLAVSEGDQAVASAQYALLEPQWGTMLQTGAVSVDRVLALLARTMNDSDRARDHFENALDLCRRAGYRSELAWTCHDYADLLLQKRDPADGGRARSLLNEGQSLAEVMGLRPLRERIAALQEEAGSRPAPAYPDALTHREVEVLSLIALGQSNQEIASELVVTPRTVERHITNIYRKINARNKADATAYALRQGLAPLE
ncbi:MAG: AAA family ATPase [Dehalococcoidia bacterium]